jgi:CheY-like chemotaxis protein
VHTLLLADESITIQRVIELIFADHDVDVVAVADGEEAIRCVDTAPPDIVLADIAMPRKDGYEVARYMKHNPRLAHIPVVLLAGAFDAVDQERARAAGCAGVLAKPLEPELVISRVQELLAAPFSAGVAALLDVPPVSTPREEKEVEEDENARHPFSTRARELDTYFDTLDAAFSDRLKAEAGTEDAGLPMDEALPVPVRPDTPPGSTLADTFAALLAGKVDQPTMPASAPPEITDEIIEQVSRRVLAQLSERVVRERVSEIVSSIAERLVREEIERIKSSIK